MHINMHVNMHVHVTICICMLQHACYNMHMQVTIIMHVNMHVNMYMLSWWQRLSLEYGIMSDTRHRMLGTPYFFLI